MKYGTKLGGEPFYQAALDYARTTSDQRERRVILSTLATYAGEAELETLYEEVQGEDWQGQEAWSVMQSSLNNEDNRDKAWALYKQSFDQVLPRTPEIRKPQTAGAVAAFCTPEDIKAAKSFIESKSDLMPGYERSLAQAEEAANLCAAFRSEKTSDLKTALEER